MEIPALGNEFATLPASSMHYAAANFLLIAGHLSYIFVLITNQKHLQ